MVPSSDLYLLAPVLTLFFTKFGKIVSTYLSKGKLTWRILFESGGMPSEHSAIVCSLTTVIGLINGLRSPLFAISAVMSLIVLYDSVNVRLSVGRQGDAINLLVSETKSSARISRIAYGHKLSEMLVGALVGVTIGLVIFYLR